MVSSFEAPIGGIRERDARTYLAGPEEKKRRSPVSWASSTQLGHFSRAAAAHMVARWVST